MKKIFSFLLLATAVAANAQQINGSFDADWEECYPWSAGSYSETVRGKQPQGWRSSNVLGVGNNYTEKNVTETAGYGGAGKAALIQNQSVFLGNWSPGYLTLGTPWNTSTGTSNKDGGTWGGMKFRYRPDAIKFQYKWNMTTKSKASFIGYLWKGTYKQEEVPSETTLSKYTPPTMVTMEDRDRNILNMETPKGGNVTEKGTLIASYEEYIETSATDWTSKTIKFNYKTSDVPEKINVIFCSTDYFVSSVPKAENALTIDNVTLVYYKHLKSLTINGSTPANFDGTESADNTEKVNIDASDTEYTEGCVVATPAGAGAKVKESYNPLTAVCNVVVTAGDKKTKTYEIQFKQVYNVQSYENSLLVYYGEYFPISQNTIQLLSHKEREQYGFVLEHFMFGGGDMGTIYVKNLAKTTNADGSATYKTPEPEMVFIEGLDGSVPVSVVATVDSKNQMTATITIPLDETPEGTVTVTYGPQLTISPATSMEVSNAVGLTNVVMKREFKQGWNTYCLPFDYELANLGEGVKAQEFVSANEHSLTFNAVSGTKLEANKPYLVFFPTATTIGTDAEPVYFATTVNSYNPTEVTFGDITFKGNYAAGMSMTGLYGVATDTDNNQKLMLGAAGATLPAGCAYFSTTQPSANGLRICFDGGEITNIQAINGGNKGEKAAVYNLQGVKVSSNGTNGLPAGLYIQQGKKVIVK